MSGLTLTPFKLISPKQIKILQDLPESREHSSCDFSNPKRYLSSYSFTLSYNFPDSIFKFITSLNQYQF